VDPGGRDGSRAPIPWDSSPEHGWPARPWLPWPPQPALWNAERQGVDPDSVLALYRRLLERRRRSAALAIGTWRLHDSPTGTLVYERSFGADVRLVAANFTDRLVAGLAAPDGWQVEVATHLEREDRSWDGGLDPAEAVVLKRG
jgi:alpha-glucosidase